MNLRIAVCPGSFDPVTCGHLDVIERASKMFDKLIVGVFCNPDKKPLFTVEERVQMLREVTAHLPGVEVDAFDGLLVDFARSHDARFIVRGLRAVSDFEYEFQMASINRKLAPDIDTVFVMTSTEYAFLSSSATKQVASFGGCVRGLVPGSVERRLREKFAARAKG